MVHFGGIPRRKLLVPCQVTMLKSALQVHSSHPLTFAPLRHKFQCTDVHGHPRPLWTLHFVGLLLLFSVVHGAGPIPLSRKSTRQAATFPRLSKNIKNNIVAAKEGKSLPRHALELLSHCAVLRHVSATPSSASRTVALQHNLSLTNHDKPWSHMVSFSCGLIHVLEKGTHESHCRFS